MCSPMRRRSIVVDAADHAVEIDDSRLQHLLAAEGEQLLVRAAAAARRPQSISLAASGVLVAGPLQSKLRVAR